MDFFFWRLSGRGVGRRLRVARLLGPPCLRGPVSRVLLPLPLVYPWWGFVLIFLTALTKSDDGVTVVGEEGSGVRIFPGRGNLSGTEPRRTVGRGVIVVEKGASVDFSDASLVGGRRLRDFRFREGSRCLLCVPGVVGGWPGAGVRRGTGGEREVTGGMCERSSELLKGKRSSRDLPEARADTTLRYSGSCVDVGVGVVEVWAVPSPP